MTTASREIEADTLGGLMLASARGAPQACEIAGVLGPDAFHFAEHRVVWSALFRLASAGEPHDGLQLADRLEKSGEIDYAGGFAGVMGLQVNTMSSENLEPRARLLREYANRRALIAACAETMELAARADVPAAVASLSQKLDSIMASGAKDASSFIEVVTATTEHVAKLEESRRIGRPSGIPFGIPALDSLTGGMRGGELIGIAARTSIGKTALANQVAVHAATQGYPGLIISLEESPEGIGLRAVANRGSLNLGRLRGGLVSVGAVSDVIREHGMVNYPLWVDTQTFDLASIISRITQYARKHRIGYAIVDHIGLVRVPTKGNRYEQVGEVTRSLKQLAMQLNIAVVPLIQVGRDSEKQSRRPMLSDLRESGNIEQDLNVCIAMHPTAAADQSGMVPLEIGLLKNRYGPRAWLDSKFEFHGAVQQLRELYSDEMD